ncbi:hypothetical protein [Bradyrhizobium uaiense]|nr:hypothetical protein [Bradyrhizobium uaiense]
MDAYSNIAVPRGFVIPPFDDNRATEYRVVLVPPEIGERTLVLG